MCGERMKTVRELIAESAIADQETEAIFITTVKKDGHRYKGSGMLMGHGKANYSLVKQLFKVARRTMAEAGVKFS